MPTTYTLATLNAEPEKAQGLIAKLTELLGDKYEIKFVGNATDVSGTKALIEEHKPDVFFTASMFTEEQAQQAVADAKSVKPDIKTISLPHGLQAEQGPAGVIKYVSENLPKVLEG